MAKVVPGKRYRVKISDSRFEGSAGMRLDKEFFDKHYRGGLSASEYLATDYEDNERLIRDKIGQVTDIVDRGHRDPWNAGELGSPGFTEPNIDKNTLNRVWSRVFKDKFATFEDFLTEVDYGFDDVRSDHNGGKLFSNGSYRIATDPDPMGSYKADLDMKITLNKDGEVARITKKYSEAEFKKWIIHPDIVGIELLKPNGESATKEDLPEVVGETLDAEGWSLV